MQFSSTRACLIALSSLGQMLHRLLPTEAQNQVGAFPPPCSAPPKYRREGSCRRRKRAGKNLSLPEAQTFLLKPRAAQRLGASEHKHICSSQKRASGLGLFGPSWHNAEERLQSVAVNPVLPLRVPVRYAWSPFCSTL